MLGCDVMDLQGFDVSSKPNFDDFDEILVLSDWRWIEDGTLVVTTDTVFIEHNIGENNHGFSP